MEWTDATGDVCALVETPIAIETSINFVRSPSAGAVSTFLGTTRDCFEGKRVTSLTYESYVEMAIESLKELCRKIRQQWAVTKIALIHKLGDCPIGEISVLIAISSAHRKESLEAVHFAIDELKKTVPIWKKVFIILCLIRFLTIHNQHTTTYERNITKHHNDRKITSQERPVGRPMQTSIHTCNQQRLFSLSQIPKHNITKTHKKLPASNNHDNCTLVYDDRFNGASALPGCPLS